MSAKSTLKTIKGMPDILPEQAAKWRYVENLAADFLGKAGFREIRTPVLEQLELFTHSVGESSDIVRKEMYTLEDMGQRHLALRPEGTAPVVRASIQHNLTGQGEAPLLWYCGPMFRQENTQKGRQRQFHQIGVEAFGTESPLLDAEIIALNFDLLGLLGVSDLQIIINSLGDNESRAEYREELIDFLDGVRTSICEDCQQRKELNPLRVLDCKQKGCQEIYQQAPVPSDYLSDNSKRHFDIVKQSLTNLDIPFDENSRLVRGLDYYTDTVFEIHSAALGAQSAVSAGGRYDGLFEKFSATKVPAFGFAMGLERIMLLMHEKMTEANSPRLAWIALDEEARVEGLAWLRQLRSSSNHRPGIEVIQFLHKGSVKAQMRAANNAGATHVLLRGETERAEDCLTVKHLETGEQVSVNMTLDSIMDAVMNSGQAD